MIIVIIRTLKILGGIIRSRYKTYKDQFELIKCDNICKDLCFYMRIKNMKDKLKEQIIFIFICMIAYIGMLGLHAIAYYIGAYIGSQFFIALVSLDLTIIHIGIIGTIIVNIFKKNNKEDI